MSIRVSVHDRHSGELLFCRVFDRVDFFHGLSMGGARTDDIPLPGCLLYTSDAADERSSVDLGGRRIIKNKKTKKKKKKRKNKKNKSNDATELKYKD